MWKVKKKKRLTQALLKKLYLYGHFNEIYQRNFLKNKYLSNLSKPIKSIIKFNHTKFLILMKFNYILYKIRYLYRT